ncbi:MAG TPA: nucleoside-diphosphate sugar epimerase/dehydratase [Anaerolineales bacterium]|nr:nucleoside-diphosphate sugar epimerase/dehydratase [Anaerolineales bacterium]
MTKKLLFRNRTMLAGDLFLIVVCVLGSFVLRVNLGARLFDFLFQILSMVGLALLIKPLVYYFFGLYRRLWAYASIQELKLIALAVTTASILVGLGMTILSLILPLRDYSRSVLFIDWALSLLAVGGLRLSLRIYSESQSNTRSIGTRNRRVLIVGAGEAGALVVREMQRNPNSNLQPVCFVDDDPIKQRHEIHGTPVVGKLTDLAQVIDARNIEEVIIAIPSAPGQVIRLVTDVCRLKNIPFRTMPSIHELIGGKISVNRLRDVDITDLLRRAPAHIDMELIGNSLGGKRILVTGAGGSIGRELCRQIVRWKPSALVLLGHGENSIFETLIELEQSYPEIQICPVIADIRNLTRLNQVFTILQPQVIFHTAAHKHLPLMQVNIEEAISNNVTGTRNVVDAALHAGVERLVMISTDKAISPTSVYGASKRMGEMIVLDAARRSGRAFSVVRFGNVLGSRGSVVLLFRRQIDSGGPVTVTHPEMERYFMTIPEAVHLVLQAFAMGVGGEVFVLNMGEQIRILDLAQDLIRLSGLEPGSDIEIIFTGIRPGEKLSEALWDEGADYQPTGHPDILRLDEDELLRNHSLIEAIDTLSASALLGDRDEIIRLLNIYVPNATVSSALTEDLTAIL